MASLCYAATGISFTCSMCLVSYHSQILNSKKLKGAKKEDKAVEISVIENVADEKKERRGTDMICFSLRIYGCPGS